MTLRIASLFPPPLAVATAFAVFVPTMASAQSQADEIAAIRSEIAALSKRLAALEAADPKAVVSDETGPVTSMAASDGGAGQASEVVPVLTLDRESVTADRSLRLRTSKGGAFAVMPGTHDRALQDGASGMQIAAASGSGVVSIKLSRKESTSETTAGDQVFLVSNQLTWTAQAPISKGATRTDILTLDSLASDFELRLAWSRYRRPVRDYDDVDVMAIASQAEQACRSTPGFKDEAEREKTCGGQMDGGFVRTYLGETGERRLLDAMYPGTARVYGFEGRIGYKEHSFVDPVALRMASEDHSPWGVRAYYAWLPKHSTTSWTVSADYQRIYEDRKSGTICPPGGGGAVTCLTGAVGAPASKEKLLTSAEWRWLSFPGQGRLISTFGVSTLVSYDHRSDDYGIDVPIYLAPDDKGNLIGGIRLGYKSTDDEITAGVFVGSTFSLR